MPIYDAVYDKYNSRPEYNYFGLEKPLAGEIVDMAKRFDREKQDLLDILSAQQKVINRLEEENHIISTRARSPRVTETIVERRIPIRRYPWTSSYADRASQNIDTYIRTVREY